MATGALNFFMNLGGAFGAVLTAALPSGPPYAFATILRLTIPFIAVALISSLYMHQKRYLPRSSRSPRATPKP